MKAKLQSGVEQRFDISQEVVSSLVHQQLATDLQSKVCHQDFKMAYYIAETIIDELIDRLNTEYKRLNTLV